MQKKCGWSGPGALVPLTDADVVALLRAAAWKNC